MRGLETISATRRNGQGPNSTFPYNGSMFIWIHLYTLYVLQKVTQYANSLSIFFTSESGVLGRRSLFGMRER